MLFRARPWSCVRGVVAALLVLAGSVGFIAACGPRSGDSYAPGKLYPYDVRGRSADAVARILDLASEPRVTHARAAKELLAKAIVDHAYAWLLAHAQVLLGSPADRANALLADLGALVGDLVVEVTPASTARVFARARNTVAVLVRPTSDLGIMARLLEGYEAPGRLAGRVNEIYAGEGPARAAAHLYVVAQGLRALHAYLLANGAVPPVGGIESPTRPVVGVARRYPFPCAPVLIRYGKYRDFAARRRALAGACSSICPSAEDCWAHRPLDPEHAVLGSTSAALMATFLEDLGARAVATLEEADADPAYALVRPHIEAVNAYLERGLPGPLTPPTETEVLEEWPAALPGAPAPSAAVAVFHEGARWRLRLRSRLVLHDAVARFVVPTAAAAEGFAGDTELPGALAKLASVAPEVVGPDSPAARTVAAFVNAEVRAERLAALVSAALAAGFARVELGGRGIGGGFASLARVDPREAPADRVELVLVADAVVERRGDASVVHPHDRPLRVGPAEGMPAAILLRFDPAITVNLVADVAEKLSLETTAVIHLAAATGEAVVDAREAAALEKMKDVGGYSEGRLRVVRDALEGTLRGCHVAGHGAGTVKVRAIISIEGAVMSLKVLETTYTGKVDAMLRRCWSSAIEKLSLPRPTSPGITAVDQELELE